MMTIIIWNDYFRNAGIVGSKIESDFSFFLQCNFNMFKYHTANYGGF